MEKDRQESSNSEVEVICSRSQVHPLSASWACNPDGLEMTSGPQGQRQGLTCLPETPTLSPCLTPVLSAPAWLPHTYIQVSEDVWSA